MRSLAILGATGSIGTQALAVVRAERDDYEVVALGASTSVDQLAEQAHEFHPKVVAIADETRRRELETKVPVGTEVVAGADAFADVSTTADVVLNAVVGFAGLPVTLAALTAGKRLALANKESLIAAGPVVQRARATKGAELIPVDSEHCAVHQCLRSGDSSAGERIVLTASGGPFRGRQRAELEHVTIDDALAHPTWRMGPKITVDSSTLMNKGLEVIEAHELFGQPAGPAGAGVGFDQIEVVVHPQSIVHSMVETTDGATMAQLSIPDMRLPIGYALAFPDRLATAYGAIDWSQLGRLDFEAPDLDAFPCLRLAYEAGQAGGCAPATLNAANEIAVEAFLAGAIGWLAIADVIRETLDGYEARTPDDLDVVLEADRVARQRARRAVERRAKAA